MCLINLQINKEYAKFRKKGLDPDLVTKNDFMFGSTVATGEFAWTPSSNYNVPLVSHPNSTDENFVTLNDSEDDLLEKSVERFLHEDDDDLSDGATSLGKRQRKGKGKLESQSNVNENKPRKGKIQKGGVAAKLRYDISKLVTSVEKKATSEAGYTIKDAMDDLHSIPDIEKYSDMYFLAVSMFEHKAKRELWKHLKTAEAKVGWLKYQKQGDNVKDKN